jgi:hypothetical protein
VRKRVLIDRLHGRKGLVAEFTFVPFVVVHLLVMTDQRVLCVVAFVALQTLERFLARMCSHMQTKWRNAAKLLPANRTFFPTQYLEVLSQMRLQRILFHEFLGTLGALKLLLPMDGPVKGQLQLTLEILATNIAFFWSVVTVRNQMRLEVDLEGEAAATELADKLLVRMLAGVVFLEGATVLEFDVAMQTFPGNGRKERQV